MPRLQQLLDDFAVTVKTLCLVERTFIVIQSQPVHTVKNRLHGFFGRTLPVGVFNAQNKLAAVFAGKQPGKQRGTGTTDMQVTGGTGGKAGADGHDALESSELGCVL